MTKEIKNLADVRMLVVEDNPRYWRELQESLQEDYGYREIEIAENPREALEKLKTGWFDVIIADMRLGEDMKGGFLVLNEVKTRNITSIVIILTANENWLDCRDAFQGGARDYLSKSMRGDVFEILQESILAALEYAEKYGNRRDELWVEENHEKLVRDYHNRYIAVMNNTVIDSDLDRETLLKRIRERKLPMLVPIIQHMVVEDIQKLPIEDVIKRGEDKRVEFKQTLRCDIQDGNKKDEIEHATLKTIAAFLNSEGGILLIGVENNRQIFGLKMDYASLGKRQDWDGFALKLDELIVDRIGTEFARYIQCEPYPLEGKEIAVVRVQKAFSLAFVLEKNKKDKDFYVRMNASTRALNVEEMYRYLTN